MTLFLFSFLLIYGSVHLYTFLKAKAALEFSAAPGSLLALLMLVMGLAPIIVHALERAGLELPARVMAYIGYIWMGVLFLFFSYSLAADFYRLLIYLGGSIFSRDLSTLRLSPGTRFFFPLASLWLLQFTAISRQETSVPRGGHSRAPRFLRRLGG